MLYVRERERERERVCVVQCFGVKTFTASFRTDAFVNQCGHHSPEIDGTPLTHHTQKGPEPALQKFMNMNKEIKRKIVTLLWPFTHRQPLLLDGTGIWWY